MTSRLSEEQERDAAKKMDRFYESVGVSRLDRSEGYWLKCRECGKEWKYTVEMTPLDSLGVPKQVQREGTTKNI